MDITIIGTGNVATILGKIFLQKGHKILQVVGRNEEATRQLSSVLECPYSLNLNETNQRSDLYIIAVSDKAVAQLTDKIIIPKESVIVHTAGGVSIDVFKDNFAHYGVLYPLQSLRKENNHLPEIPFFIDGNDEIAKNKLYGFVKDVSDMVAFADDLQRMKLHVAAVFTSNFPNFLYTLASDFCNRQQIDFQNLIPLMKETVHRLRYFNPAEMQTGPAVRRDETTMKNHLQLLEDAVALRDVYCFLSGEITKYF